MAPDTKTISRRAFFTGERTAARAGSPDEHCISSAVVSLLPRREDEVLAQLAGMPGVTTCARQGVKLVLLLEGPNSGAVGSLLARIAVIDGVISANMVFEHSETAWGE